jgi:hypothetical protein
MILKIFSIVQASEFLLNRLAEMNREQMIKAIMCGCDKNRLDEYELNPENVLERLPVGGLQKVWDLLVSVDNKAANIQAFFTGK